MVDWKSLTREEKATKRQAAESIAIQTANGVVEVRMEVDIQVLELGITVAAFILADTPPLLSLGKLVKDYGIECRWTNKQPPTLILPSGKEVQLEQMNNVPIVTAGRDDW